MRYFTINILNLVTLFKTGYSNSENNSFSIEHYRGDSIQQDLKSLYLSLDDKSFDIDRFKSFLKKSANSDPVKNGLLENDAEILELGIALSEILKEPSVKIHSIEGIERYPELQVVLQTYLESVEEENKNDEKEEDSEDKKEPSEKETKCTTSSSITEEEYSHSHSTTSTKETFRCPYNTGTSHSSKDGTTKFKYKTSASNIKKDKHTFSSEDSGSHPIMLSSLYFAILFGMITFVMV